MCSFIVPSSDFPAQNAAETNLVVSALRQQSRPCVCECSVVLCLDEILFGSQISAFNHLVRLNS